MPKITINSDKTIGKIKPMNAINVPPVGGYGERIDVNFHYLKEIGVPYARLHDVGVMFGGYRYVDIPNIFRNFDADADDPASYDFTFTDALMKALIKNGIEPYYRLGVSIENNAEIKNYYLDPPKDYDKWASICEHIIAHYNEGWADGYHMNITYWEIWNEPDDGMRQSHMWNGTPEDYYRLYDVTAKRLKKRFPNIKVGGYASISLELGYLDIDKSRPDYKTLEYYLDFFHGFWQYVKEHNTPINFYSWHTYAPPDSAVGQAEYIHKCLIEYGYENVEIHLNEWNPFPAERGTARHGAFVASMILRMQDLPYVDMLMLYHAAPRGTYGAFFDPYTGLPIYHAYYVFAAFNKLYELENEVELSLDAKGVYAVASAKDGHGALLITNVSGEDQALEIEGVSLDDAHWYVIDSKRLMSWSCECKTIENNSVILVEFDV